MKKLACVTLDMEPDYGDPEKKIRLLEDPKYFEPTYLRSISTAPR